MAPSPQATSANAASLMNSAAPIPNVIGANSSINNENEPKQSHVVIKDEKAMSPLKKAPIINSSQHQQVPAQLTQPLQPQKQEWNHEERRKVETRNNNMRQIIYKEVKRPGRNYDRLLELLKELHGPAEIRQQYILDVIKEANRFKRNHMAKTILKNMANLVSIDSST